MQKFQLDFTKVPKQLRLAVGQEVQKILSLPDKYNFCLNRNYIIIGYSSRVEWDDSPYRVEEYPVYDVLRDWDTWNAIVTPTWKVKGLPISADYSAEVHSDHVKVGCQRISFDSVEKLAQIVAEARAFAKK